MFVSLHPSIVWEMIRKLKVFPTSWSFGWQRYFRILISVNSAAFSISQKTIIDCRKNWEKPNKKDFCTCKLQWILQFTSTIQFIERLRGVQQQRYQKSTFVWVIWSSRRFWSMFDFFRPWVNKNVKFFGVAENSWKTETTKFKGVKNSSLRWNSTLET